MRIKHPIALVLLTVLAAGLLAGIAKATSGSASGFQSASDKVRFTTSGVNLSTVGMTNVTIVFASLPAGSWIISAKGNFVNFGPSDYTRCQLFAGDTSIEGGGITTLTGDSSLPGAQGPGAYVQAFADIGVATSATIFTVSLRCSHDHDTPSGNGPPYIDPGATIWAHLAS